MYSEQSGIIGYRIAGLGIWYLGKCITQSYVPPETYQKFIQPVSIETQALFRQDRTVFTPDLADNLVLQVLCTPMDQQKPTDTLIYRSDTWKFWQDDLGFYTFAAPFQRPQCKIQVDSNFRMGVVQGDFTVEGGEGFNPLRSLEIRLFSAWLAGFKDLILHAAGIIKDGQAYCFVGHSGAGKSTLAKSLAADPSVTVLGEDQVILRYIDGQFWIYGTPWHLDPEMCSPQGGPLKKLYFLDRHTQPGVNPISQLEAVTRMLQTAFIPYYQPAWVTGILEHLEILVKRVPMHILRFQLGTDPWELIKSA